MASSAIEGSVNNCKVVGDSVAPLKNRNPGPLSFVDLGVFFSAPVVGPREPRRASWLMEPQGPQTSAEVSDVGLSLRGFIPGTKPLSITCR